MKMAARVVRQSIIQETSKLMAHAHARTIMHLQVFSSVNCMIVDVAHN